MRTKPLSILILIFAFGCSNYAIEDLQSPNTLNCKSPEFDTPNYYWFEGNKIPIYQNSDLSYVFTTVRRNFLRQGFNCLTSITYKA